METKACTKCGLVKAVEAFYVKDQRTGRRFSWCTTCHNTRTLNDYHQRQATKPSKPVITERACTGCGVVLSVGAFPLKSSATGQRRAVCQECHNTKNAAYKAANREKVRAANAAYRDADREAYNERLRRWHAEHREVSAARTSRWKANHKDAVNAQTHRRRNTIIINGGHWTAAEWQALKAEYDYRCLMCGRQEPAITLTVDHIIPVSQGGSNTIDNLQPLCKSCNSKKYRGIVDLRRKREP